MKAASVAEALAAIPGLRNELDQKDDTIRDAIRRTEHVLFKLGPGVTTHLAYVSALPESSEALHWVGFEKLRGSWVITWTDRDDSSEDEISPLLSTSRLVRTEVFTPMEQFGGLAPIERLVIEVVDNLSAAGASRSPMLQVVDRLMRAFDEAGFKKQP